ncbi:hypothetical protein [Ornithinibacillus sp. 179-J 7C1 HS]|uniref:hypothetical protein n=1 Tax=Ornithinibacillus sp. 179-J 7C1 HS TaxID=3142384 RepID=UPI00399EFE9E
MEVVNLGGIIQINASYFEASLLSIALDRYCLKHPDDELAKELALELHNPPVKTGI